jgi:hypothetical protein
MIAKDISESKVIVHTTAHDRFTIEGNVSQASTLCATPSLRTLFGELGGACCGFSRGEKVVDLWGGIRNKQTGEPWEKDTIHH